MINKVNNVKKTKVFHKTLCCENFCCYRNVATKTQKKLWPQNCISLQNYVKPIKCSTSISHLKNTPSHIEYRELLMSTNQNLPHPLYALTTISTSITHQVGMSETIFQSDESQRLYSIVSYFTVAVCHWQLAI